MPEPDLLDLVLTRDRPALRRQLFQLKPRPRQLSALPEALQKRFEQSIATRAQRRERRPRPTFPGELPVNQRREEIAETIRTHQVVIVCGETGSGKTTQLPKICLELGRGEAGLIGHTQPRRLAARATAARIAEELGSELGTAVGFKVRFTDHTKPESYIKLMTDGILLAETQGDPALSAYDTLIIDEAHERSVNIDFLLGYLRQLLSRRPDLKLIVTSATLDAERFAKHFALDGKPAPVIEVSGRLYPIEIRYRPIEEDEPVQQRSATDRRLQRRDDRRSHEPKKDLYEAIVDAVGELQREDPGDVLVFLPGEREIREAADALRHDHLPGTEILPLYARQSAQEQARVFSRSNGRRVVLSTNVAETSLTVPGIRYVVDAGLARINRYSHRNKVELLQIEKIAQSAAKQRAGRCGRVQDGVCIRLYDEEDFNRRPAHTDPEVLRSSLAGVILRMKSLKLGAVEAFPFIDAPSPKMIADGYQLLNELGAVDDDNELTPVGRELAKLPLDPKIGRMILAARDRGALAEVLVIAAALSVQDPRERPPESPGTADQAHARFRLAPDEKGEPRSEFLWYWNLWRAADEVWRKESSSKQKVWCRTNFLNWLRMREWRDIHTQLHELCAEHGWIHKPGKDEAAAKDVKPASYEAIHKALLTGLLGHIGLRLEDASGPWVGAFQGARGIKFWPHPGFFMAKRVGKWLMAAELIDTSKLFARCIARIEPEWLEEVGAHLVRKSVFEPHWEKTKGVVRAWERGVLHGITLYARRPCGYAEVDPALCRELLIRDGLVVGEIEDAAARNMPFFLHNRRLVAEIERLEQKMRRPDLLVDEALIEAFYEAQIPAEVTDLRAFEAWRKQAERKDPKCLHLEREQLMRHEAAGVTSDKFPASFEVMGQKLKLSYVHEPREADDGVTLTVPVAMLNQVPANRCEWLVPGMLEEKVTALLKTVPQKHRHRLQPIGESARAFIEAVEAGEFKQDEPIIRALQRFVEVRVSLKLDMASFRNENLNPHCFMNFRVIDQHGRVLDQSRDLAALRLSLKDSAAAAFRAAQIEGSMGAQLAALNVQGKTATGVDEVHENGAGKAEIASSQGSIHAATRDMRDENGLHTQFSGITTWSFGPLPELLEVKIGNRNLIGFPALHDDGDSVSLRPFDTEEEAVRVHRKGLVRLFALNLKDQVRAVERLPGLRPLALQFMPFGTEAELKAQLVEATLVRCCLMEPLPVNPTDFNQRALEAKTRVSLIAQELMRLAGTLLAEHASLQKRFASLKSFPELLADVQAQVGRLLPKNFLVAWPFEKLSLFPRYLKAIDVRIEKMRNNPARDAQLMAEWKSLAGPWEREHLAKLKAGVSDPQLEDFRWLLEELRVGLFAQELKTPMPVSVKRLQKIWESRPR
ncbi:MAG: ATP-dependent RNA helicase HrpA [Candidatus Dactylopiibacterium carminicum]|uniref:ATP-dependent RNA helicase HrpA n=1 Tax=Candidatus Dactylopiibacterium carminicum TaxID=857335 RepID=A0A272EW20_9RHOO|nr:ATP-dependent RNA helicase HrpA [Candidatus Dactylopiibacterium carminicum]KAF7600322.1 ATP-dependent RNA helicase HrpA [Candidatus Dactylopiibacterium carminicum]PAS93850.1 MAG: ATP-dependent RNA helicase HrpA [Candidatus Dactylopiibacterium carminicum]PAT00324.1 MAG: ATP-dependent RNA helicase HrpA [Candidatus Dactylopiibacterium carminicum]